MMASLTKDHFNTDYAHVLDTLNHNLNMYTIKKQKQNLANKGLYSQKLWVFQ